MRSYHSARGALRQIMMHRYIGKALALLPVLTLSFWIGQTHADCVILLHGLARSHDSMDKLEARLLHENFEVVNIGYPSRHHSIPKLTELAIKPALAECAPGAKVHFVTHSLGGILVRQHLSTQQLPRLGRVVMLGPPNKGSEVVDKLGGFPGFHFINGDAGLQLGTSATSIPNQLGSANFDVGIIAGTHSINWILSTLIPGPDDGKVAVSSTKLSGMADHLILPVTHPFMMKDKEVIQQTIYFLRNGRFDVIVSTHK